MIAYDTLKLARKLMDANGLQDWRVELDNGTSRAGVCRYGTKNIGLSKEISRINHHDAVKATILHEIAHALTPGHGHNTVWRVKCLELGGDGKARYTAEDKTILQKFKATCDCDGKVFHSNRRLQHRACPTCKKSIVWKRNEQKTIKR